MFNKLFTIFLHLGTPGRDDILIIIIIITIIILITVKIIILMIKLTQEHTLMPTDQSEHVVGLPAMRKIVVPSLGHGRMLEIGCDDALWNQRAIKLLFIFIHVGFISNFNSFHSTP